MGRRKETFGMTNKIITTTADRPPPNVTPVFSNHYINHKSREFHVGFFSISRQPE
jgi:hypothetical protein